MDSSIISNHSPVSNLLKRDAERQLDLQKKRNDKKLFNAEHEQFNYFTEIFQDKIKLIEKLLETAPIISQKEIAFHFDKISREIHNLQKFVADSLLFLRGYDIRICQESLIEIEAKSRKLEEQLIPKKKFGFKNKRSPKKTDEIISQDIVDSAKKNINFEDSFFGFKNKSNLTLILNPDSLDKKDVTLQNLDKCVVKLYGTPTTLHMSSMNDCVVLCGPVSTSILAENCKNCNFIIACQQLRLHNSSNCEIYLHVTSRAIIEDCKNIRVAPYNFVYDNSKDDFEKAGLDRNVNHWKEIDDFNWLVAEKHSPNWRVLDDSERVTDWEMFIMNL